MRTSCTLIGNIQSKTNRYTVYIPTLFLGGGAKVFGLHVSAHQNLQPLGNLIVTIIKLSETTKVSYTKNYAILLMVQKSGDL